MIIPRLLASPIDSLQDSQQFQRKTNSSSNNLKDSLTCSTLDNSSKFNKSSVSFNDSRLYSSAATYNSTHACQEQLIDRKHMCMFHYKKFTYTCLTCRQNQCSECLMNPGKHRSHRFQRYNEKREDMRVLRENLLSQINLIRDKINKQIENVSKSDKIINNEKYKLDKLQQHEKSLSMKINQNLLEFQDSQKDYKNDIKQYNQYYEQCLVQLTKATRVALINRTSQSIEAHLSNKIESLKKFQHKAPVNNLNIFMKPNFYSNIFTVCNFTKIRQTTKEKIFQPFQAFQSMWRLKVYPTGYAGVQVDEKLKGIDYMSVYAQRIDGFLQNSSYIIRIQITSRSDPRLMIKKQFKSQFTKSQSWGYDRFTKLSNIYDHGFLGQDDTLFIKISICPSTYHEATRALQENISKKEKILQQNERKIKILKVMIEKKQKQMENKSNNQQIVENKQQKKQLLIETNPTQDSQCDELKIPEQDKLQTKNKNECQKLQKIEEKLEYMNPQNENQNCNERMTYNFSARFKEQIKEKISERTSGLGLTRNRGFQQNYPSISLEKKSPGKLIRLVSLKNTQLITNSRKKIHNRSSTFF